MAEINLLDSSIFNRIAAGEVVENPGSVIKELVENSIDAGADQITVEIRSGGIEFIRVSDNGGGLFAEDMPTAFLPHATSKIKTLEDLNRIATLGFRGEALPSISSVAKVTMISRPQACELGCQICFENGKLLDSAEIGSPLGTSVIVENLFKNVPAREKFLKKPSLEEADVTELILKLILAKPLISFKYVCDGKTVYHSNGGGTEPAVYTVYGDNIFSNLVPIQCIMPDITLNGYVNKPSFSKHNRTYQTLIVNGRFVLNSEISFCVQQCFQEFLMKRQFPMYVLYLNLPLDMVDVNVRPNKMDVKFVNFRRIKGILYHVIREKVLEQTAIPKNLTSNDPGTAPEMPTEPVADILPAKKETETREEQPVRFSLFGDAGTKNVLREQSSRLFERSFSSEQPLNRTKEPESKSAADETATTAFGDVLKRASFQIIGKLFRTYLILQEENNVFLIDQHAAHEKLLYDKLVSELDGATVCVQDLLLPYVFEVTHTEKVLLDENLADICALGFHIRPFGGLSYAVSGIPACCSEMNMQEFTTLFLRNFNLKAMKKSDFLKESLMQSACKAAVKGEQDLTQNEIETLLQEMKLQKSALFCPHGRPTVVRLSREEIEKWFKRIV